MKLAAKVAFFAITLMAMHVASAQQYPTKLVRIMTYSTPGSGTDRMLRVIAEDLSKTWGRPVVIENRPGASGVILGQACARAPADGHTICLLDRGPYSTLPHLYKNKSLPYDPQKDFEPVTNLAFLISVLAASPKLSADSVNQLVSLAKAKPGSLNYGSIGIGSSPHLVVEWINKKYGVDIVHIPFKSPPDLVQALASNEIHVAYFGLMNMLGLIRDGKLTALAVSGSRRTALLPNVPTMAEAGLNGLDDQIWFGLFVPTGTPKDIPSQIHRDVARIVSDPVFAERNLLSQGWEPVLSSPDSFAKFLATDREVSGELVRTSGARLD